MSQIGNHAAFVKAVSIKEEAGARDSPGPGYRHGADWSSDWRSLVVVGGESISSYAASSGFLHTKRLGAALVGEGELRFEKLASVEAVVAGTKAFAIAAEGTRQLAVAAAQVNIEDVGPSFAELTLASDQFDMEGGPGR